MKSFLILATGTIVLAIYTLFGMRWWLRTRDSLSKRSDLRSKRIVAVLALPVIVAVIAAPLFILDWLMNEAELFGSVGPFYRFAAGMMWIGPGAIYALIYHIQRDKSEK
ncbi:MAG TPA: hypothetical protein VNU95_04575 [Candidatus Acidoferrales bacterium]|jgi:hypothetical protein|nr:hypothetical protein [Candidatus Acidoferrales bacterium]